jgi:hypothetical protein
MLGSNKLLDLKRYEKRINGCHMKNMAIIKDTAGYGQWKFLCRIPPVAMDKHR